MPSLRKRKQAINLSFRTLTATASSEIINMSQDVINHLYRNSLPQVSGLLDSEIIWIDTVSTHCFYGCSQILTGTARKPYPEKLDIRHLQYRQWATHPGTNIVTGQYKIIQKTTGRLGLSRLYQITLVWSDHADDSRLLHVHISSSESAKRHSGFLCLPGKGAGTYYVLPEEILYIEAENISCTVHTVNLHIPRNLRIRSKGTERYSA